jgi:dienelactone hydrolase
MVWIMGSNVQAYYHQSLHETLASYGYAVIAPDTRPIRFTDPIYHQRNVALGVQAFNLAAADELGMDIDPERIVFGGYSIGGTLAGFAAVQEPTAAGIVMWVPSSSPIWQGVELEDLALVNQPSFYVLGELDDVSPPEGWPATLEGLMPLSDATRIIIPDAVHLYFQQPTGVDDRIPPTTITRFEQQQTAIQATLDYLNGLLATAD